MPWVYTLTLTEYRDAGTVQSDWQSIAAGQLAHAYGGVTVIGTKAVVISTPREPNYADMEGFGYVSSVTEHKELPSNPDGPMELGYGFVCVFDDV